VTRALDLWQPVFGLRVLEELLAFAEVFVPSDAAARYGRVEVLDTIAAEKRRDTRLRIGAQLVAALMKAPWGKSSEDVIDELRARELWHEMYLGPVVLARIKAAPADWLPILSTHFPVLKVAFARHHTELLFLLEEVVALIHLRRVVAAIFDGPPLDRGVNLEGYKRVMTALFCGTDAIVWFESEPKRLTFREEEWPTVDSDLGAFAAYLGDRRTAKREPYPLEIVDTVHKLVLKLGCETVSPSVGAPPKEISDGFRFLRGGQA
jgi:hypothetical protein